jgi:glycosyltransferase involved in cell wall biosynthesis
MISIVIPVHNEAEAAPIFIERVVPIIESTKMGYEMVFVDDGSTDLTVRVLLALRERFPCIRLVQLSRNFGKEAALTAGLSYASGDAVIPMDSDLQDPPELIPSMIAKWQAGADVVLAIRRDRSSDTWVKRATAKAFYKVMRKITQIPIPENCGDYRLMDRKVVNALLSFPERNRFMKGLMAACGYKTDIVEYDRPERAAGKTKFNFWKLWNFALDGITGFSTVPLRVWTYVGSAVAGVAFLYAAWVIVKTLIWGVVTPGYATLISVVLFLGGVQLIGIGILGEYIGRIMAETKRRPVFLVGDLHGFPETAGPSVVSFDAKAARVAR